MNKKVVLLLERSPVNVALNIQPYRNEFQTATVGRIRFLYEVFYFDDNEHDAHHPGGWVVQDTKRAMDSYTACH